MKHSRRHFLKALGTTVLASSAITANPAMFSAYGADTGGYRALVCVFLFGGLDGHDVILPFNRSSYRQFQTIRQDLIARQGSSRERSNLLPFDRQSGTARLGGRRLALPPEMPGIKALYDRGRAAIVGNVGPLIEPVTRAQFEADSARLPPRLFSHNDQQATWQASAPEGAQFGWGGLFADAVLLSGANATATEFSTITTTEPGPFLTGNQASPYQVNLDGPAEIDLLARLQDSDAPGIDNVLDPFKRLISADGYRSRHLLRQDMASAINGSFSANENFNDARENAVPFSTTFPPSPIGAQLQAVAETISIRNTLGADRQIFFVGMGGFDTHSAQATTLPQLLSGLDSAISAFSAAMDDLGLDQDVTLFTASDFGRTLAVNGDGTDHGWGGHHFVVGGSVRGGLYGTFPEPVFGHSQDSGGGRLIPATSVEQYAAPLGRWFGLGESELAAALPNLRNFDAGPSFL